MEGLLGSHFIGWDGGGRWVRVGVVAIGVMIVGGAVVVDVMMDVEQWEYLQPFPSRSGLSLPR